MAVVSTTASSRRGRCGASLEALLRAGRDATVRWSRPWSLAGAQRVFGGWVRELRDRA